MSISMPWGLLWFLLIIGSWWLAAVLHRDRALAVLRAFCRREELILIDDTLVWNGFSRCGPKREPGAVLLASPGPAERQGPWPLWCYRFEISPDGRQRIGGRLWLASFGTAAWLLIDKHPQDAGNHETVQTF